MAAVAAASILGEPLKAIQLLDQQPGKQEESHSGWPDVGEFVNQVPTGFGDGNWWERYDIITPEAHARVVRVVLGFQGIYIK